MLTPRAPSKQPPRIVGPQYEELSEDKSDEDWPGLEDIQPIEPPIDQMLPIWTSREEIDAFLDDFIVHCPQWIQAYFQFSEEKQKSSI